MQKAHETGIVKKCDIPVGARMNYARDGAERIALTSYRHEHCLQ